MPEFPHQSRRTFLGWMASLAPAILLLGRSGFAQGGSKKIWRGQWNGQNSSSSLSFDEALEILKDTSAPRAFQPSAAGKVFLGVEQAIADFFKYYKLNLQNPGRYEKEIREAAGKAIRGIEQLLGVARRTSKEGGDSRIYLLRILRLLS